MNWRRGIDALQREFAQAGLAPDAEAFVNTAGWARQLAEFSETEARFAVLGSDAREQRQRILRELDRLSLRYTSRGFADLCAEDDGAGPLGTHGPAGGLAAHTVAPDGGEGPNPLTELTRVTWIVLVGVSRYKDGNALPSLEGVKSDLGLLRHTLERYGAGRIGHIWDMQDEGAARSAIKRALTEVAGRALRSDRVILYFGGHGYGVKRTWYFLPYDATPLTASARGISARELGRWLTKIRAGQMLVLLDFCHSGGLTDLWIDVERIQTEGLDRAVIATTRPQQKAEETDAGGLFLPAFCDALAGRVDRLSKKGLVYADDAYEYAKRQVDLASDYSGHPQSTTKHAVGNCIAVTRVAAQRPSGPGHK